MKLGWSCAHAWRRNDEIDHAGGGFAFGLGVTVAAVGGLRDFAAPVIIAVDDIEITAVESGGDDAVEPAGLVLVENDRLPVLVPVAHFARIGPFSFQAPSHAGALSVGLPPHADRRPYKSSNRRASDRDSRRLHQSKCTTQSPSCVRSRLFSCSTSVA